MSRDRTALACHEIVCHKGFYRGMATYFFCILCLKIHVLKIIGTCNHAHTHLLFLTQLIPQSSSHKHFWFELQSLSDEQDLVQYRKASLFVLWQSLVSRTTYFNISINFVIDRKEVASEIKVVKRIMNSLTAFLFLASDNWRDKYANQNDKVLFPHFWRQQ